MKPRNPLIQGFTQPTLTKTTLLTLADVRGDGQGKLVIWSDQQNQLIVYKGSNRQLQKPSKIKNASGIITYYDEDRSPQSVIAISAENGLYIFRSLNQSFRFRVPDIFAREEEQILWSQYQSEPEKLTAELSRLPKKTLSQTARHLLSASTIQRKMELIQKAFSQGVDEKDSISAMCNLRQTANSIGNVILGTQLNRLYILDCYGHSIVQQRVIDSAPVILLGYGKYSANFLIICINRQGQISFYMKNDIQQPSYKIKLSCRVISADLNYPDLIICTQDQVISHYIISNSNTKLHSKKYSFKLLKQPIKILLFQYKSFKITLILFQDEFRFYLQKQMIFSHYTQHKMYDLLLGSFAKEQNCMILMYENHGFQVFILHRQFNPKVLYETNKKENQNAEDIPIPKKTTEFKVYWNEQVDAKLSYKLYQKNLKLLKWMTYRQKFTQKVQKTSSLKLNSKILGLGPDFIIKLSIQNTNDQPIHNIHLFPIYDKRSIQIHKLIKQIPMLSPNITYNLDIKVQNLSLKNQTIDFQLFYGAGANVMRTTVHLPNCEEFADV